ncbi:MAG: hypothetical protein H7829_15040 [Magnetococcus sp. THC-1_WYH]
MPTPETVKSEPTKSENAKQTLSGLKPEKAPDFEFTSANDLWGNVDLMWKRLPVVGLVLNGPGDFKDDKTGEMKPYGSVKVHALVKLPVPFIGVSYGGGGVMYEIPLIKNPYLSFYPSDIDSFIRYLSSASSKNPVFMLEVGFVEVIDKDSNKKRVERVSQQTPVDIRLPDFSKLGGKH